MTRARNRREAIEAGLRYYFTGRPCRRGGIAPRRVSDQMCTCLACENDRRDRNAANYAAKRDLILERKRASYARDPEIHSVRHKQYRARFPDRIREKQRRWYARNSEAVLAAGNRRRERLRRAIPGWHGEFDRFVELEAYRLSRLRRSATGFDWHVDHIIPIKARRVCGLHVWNNFQVIPWLLNVAKGNRLRWLEPGEWLFGVIERKRR